MFLRLLRLLKIAGRDAAVLWYAVRNPATPLPVKAGAVLLAFYMVSPIDFIPDALPILGWLDDVTLLAFAIPAILKLLPQSVLRESRLAAQNRFSKWSFWRVKT